MCRGDMDLFACGMAALFGQPATICKISHAVIIFHTNIKTKLQNRSVGTVERQYFIRIYNLSLSADFNSDK
nr:MAG TPA: hypothetical protein [Caudoviricetes sp.]